MTLTINIVIDNKSVPGWVIELLCKIETSSQLVIGDLWLYDSMAQLTQKQIGKAVKSETSIAERFAHSIIDRIDKPRLSSEPLALTKLPDVFSQKSRPLVDISTKSTKTSDRALLLWLCRRPLEDCPGALNHLPAIPVWETYFSRNLKSAYTALLSGAQCLEVFLWQRCSPEDTPSQYSSHALPLQSYSVSDISVYSTACLPEVFVSRLVWLANSRSPMPVCTAPIVQALSNGKAGTDKPCSSPLASHNPLIQIAALLFRHTRQRILDKLLNEHWHLRYRLQPSGHSCQSAEFAADLQDYTALVPPKDRMWADPHTVSRDGIHHVFFEEYVFQRNKGHISALSIASDGTVSDVSTVLEETFHLSYPFIFHFDGDDYMVPETASVGAVRLYRAEYFPTRWTYLHDIISSINAADSTIFFHDGLWWMFSNGMSHPSVDERDTLMLYHSHNPVEDSWKPHPLNPIVTGVDCARMAGRVYEENGQLYRPYQYGVKRYGHGFGIARIDLLDTLRYSETPIACKTPEDQSKFIGCHTFTYTPPLTVIDAFRFSIR